MLLLLWSVSNMPNWGISCISGVCRIDKVLQKCCCCCGRYHIWQIGGLVAYQVFVESIKFFRRCRCVAWEKRQIRGKCLAMGHENGFSCHHSSTTTGMN